jgi:hypothetical protein
MRRHQFTGTITAIHATTIVMRLHPKNQTIALDAGAAVLEQARLIGAGRTVRFSAELDERTECLSSPRFVVSSSVGLQAVQVDL